jgi:ribosomal protein L16/L10AE
MFSLKITGHQFSYVKLKNVTFALKAHSTNPLEGRLGNGKGRLEIN